MTHISGSQEPRPSWIKKSRDGIDWKIWIDSLLRHPPTNNREFYLLQTILILAISRTGSLAKIEHTNPSARASLRSASVSICKSTFCALKFHRLWTIWTGWLYFFIRSDNFDHLRSVFGRSSVSCLCVRIWLWFVSCGVCVRVRDQIWRVGSHFTLKGCEKLNPSMLTCKTKLFFWVVVCLLWCMC